ncbi:unnamed protein product [Rhodiola kirilowii]
MLGRPHVSDSRERKLNTRICEIGGEATVGHSTSEYQP